MNFDDMVRAKVGWDSLHSLIDFLPKINSKITLIYLFDRFELVITDEKLFEHMDFLNIHYEKVNPSNAIRFIKEIKD